MYYYNYNNYYFRITKHNTFENEILLREDMQAEETMTNLMYCLIIIIIIIIIMLLFSVLLLYS